MRVFTMVIGMYLITFTILVLETGNVVKAALLGVLAASIKSAYSMGHYAAWRQVDARRKMAEEVSPLPSLDI